MKTEERIEKDAITVLELTKGFTPEQRNQMGNMLTSLEEMAGNVQILSEQLKQERNKAIDECIERLSSYRDIDRTQMKEELESLKTAHEEH